MQVRTFDVISIAEMSWGFCDNESRILKFGFILSCFVFITSVGVLESLLYYPSSPLEPFTALALAQDANSSSADVEVQAYRLNARPRRGDGENLHARLCAFVLWLLCMRPLQRLAASIHPSARVMRPERGP